MFGAFFGTTYELYCSQKNRCYIYQGCSGIGRTSKVARARDRTFSADAKSSYWSLCSG